MSALDEAILNLLLVLLGFLAGNFLIELIRLVQKSDHQEEQ